MRKMKGMILGVAITVFFIITWVFSRDPYVAFLMSYLAIPLTFVICFALTIFSVERRSNLKTVGPFLGFMLIASVASIWVTNKVVGAAAEEVAGLTCSEARQIALKHAGLGRDWVTEPNNVLSGKSASLGPQVNVYLYQYTDTYLFKGDHALGSGIERKLDCRG
jgi:hypothetical protein